MQLTTRLFTTVFTMCLILFMVGCGSSSGSGSDSADATVDTMADATLSALTVNGAELDQTFQSVQDSYTAEVHFLTTSLTLVPVATNSASIIMIGGSVVASGESSISMPLAEGDNIIEISVTAEDAENTATYTFEVYRETADEFAEQIHLKADDAVTGDQFGTSVAVSGDTLVVGANGDDPSGAAYIFTYIDDAWSESLKLVNNLSSTPDNFGISVALDGDTLVVGAPLADSSSGVAYVYSRESDGSWSNTDILDTDSSTDVSPYFGWSVALDGDTIVVGAPYEDETEDNSGAAYVFTRTDGTWSEQEKLKASNVDEGDNFGSSVAINGDTIVVGAPSAELVLAGISTGNLTGVAYLFTRTDDSWSSGVSLVSTGTFAGGEEIGASVAVSDDTIVVGSPGDRYAYVYTRTDGSWSTSNPAVLEGASNDDRFGSSVAVNGDTLAVGASNADENDASSVDDSGGVYVYTRTDGTWSEKAFVKATTAKDGDSFGVSVALDGDILVVGAENEDSNSAGVDDGSSDDSGAVYVWQ